LLPALVLLMGAGLVGPFLDENREPGPAMFVYGAIGGAVLCAILISSRLRDRQRALAAAGTIRWFRGEPPDKPYVDCACVTCGKRIKSIEKGERCPQCGAPSHRKRCARDHAFAAHGDDKGAYRRALSPSPDERSTRAR
jgi:hypothetical protein